MVKMNKSLKKELLTTIKLNIKKFISLTLIIFLGVAFYVGMKSNAPVLENTMIKYFDEYKYMDIQVISLIGLNDKELDELEKTVAEIDIIEGGFSEDVIVNLKNEAINEYQDYVLSVNSYNVNKKLNKVWIQDGREPTKINEILIDASMGKFGYEIGDTFTIKHNNIKEKDLVIVGTVRSPNFISIERGTTTLLNGKIDHFIYMNEENFDYDGLYNRGNIRLNTDLKPFTNEYNKFVEGVVKKIENVSNEISKERKEEILKDKEKEYNDALNKFNSEKQKALNEIQSAKNKITQGEKDILSAESKILSDKEVDLYLDNAKTKLDNAKATLDSSKATLEIAKQTIGNFDAPEMNLEYLKGKLTSAKNLLQEVNNTIDDLNSKISDKKKECSSISEDLLKKACDKALQELYNTLDENNVKAATIKKEIIQITDMIKYFENFGSNTSDLKSYISDMEKEYNNALKEYNKGLREYNNASKNLKSQMVNARNTINEKKKELEQAKKTLKEKEEEASIKFVDAENELAKARKSLDSLKDISWYVFDRTAKADYTQYYDDVQRVENISKVLPFIFFLVAALVTGSSITRMVKEERMKIGILKSLGYSNKHVLIKYIYYTGLAALIGIIVGLLFGIFGFPKVFATVYELLYFIPPLKYTAEIHHILIAVLAAILSSVVVAYFVVKGSLIEQPYYLMRPKVEKKNKKTLLEKNKKIWKKLSFMKKVAYRNVFRSIGKSLMTVLGIAGCTSLIIAGFATREALTTIIYKQYGNIFKLSGEFFFKSGLTQSEIFEEQKRIDSFDFVKATTLGSTRFVHFDVGNDKKLQTTVIVPHSLDEMNNFINYKDVYNKGNTLSLNDDGVIITEKLAKLLKVKQGDEATFIDNDNNEYTVKISGICENYVYHYMYMTKEYYKKIYKVSPENNLLIVKYKEGISNEDEANKKVISSGLYSNILLLKDAENQYNNIMEKFTIVMIVIIICAGLLAFVVLYNLAKINISERTREIATLKVLGFNSKEVNNYINREMKVLTIIGIIFGILIGNLLSKVVIQTCEVDTIMFDNSVSYVAYIYAVFLTLIFSSVINRIVKKDLHDISMVESLKSIE